MYLLNFIPQNPQTLCTGADAGINRAFLFCRKFYGCFLPPVLYWLQRSTRRLPRAGLPAVHLHNFIQQNPQTPCASAGRNRALFCFAVNFTVVFFLRCYTGFRSQRGACRGRVCPPCTFTISSSRTHSPHAPAPTPAGTAPEAPAPGRGFSDASQTKEVPYDS